MTRALNIFAAASSAQDTPVWLAPVVIAAFLAIFPLFWIGVVRLLALAGWRWLAALYRCDGTFPDGVQSYKAASLSLGRGLMAASYNNVAVITLRPEALYIRLWWLFSFGHPPIKLPWDAVETITSSKMLFWTVRRLTVRGTAISLQLSGKVGETVEADWQRHRRN